MTKEEKKIRLRFAKKLVCLSTHAEFEDAAYFVDCCTNTIICGTQFDDFDVYELYRRCKRFVNEFEQRFNLYIG